MRKIFRLKFIQYPFLVLLTYYSTFKGVDVDNFGLKTDNIFGQLAFFLSVIVLIMYILRKLFFLKNSEYMESSLSFISIFLIAIGSGVDYFDITFFEEYKMFFITYGAIFLFITLIFLLKNLLRKKNKYYDDYMELLCDNIDDFRGKFVLGTAFDGREYIQYLITFETCDDKINVYLYKDDYILRRKIYTLEDLSKKLKKGMFKTYIDDVMFKKIFIFNDYDYEDFIEYIRRKNIDI